jgi:hypothetical protein
LLAGWKAEFLRAKDLQRGPALASTLDSLGNLYLDFKEESWENPPGKRVDCMAKAKQCFDECYRIRSASLSRFDPELAAVRVSRGNWLSTSGQQNEAVHEFQRAAEIYGEAVGARHCRHMTPRLYAPIPPACLFDL